MPTICPNCLRPVRPDAKFCGFCGSSLDQATQESAVVVQPVAQVEAAAVEVAPAQSMPKPAGRDLRRSVLIVIVILLCLVLLMAFLIHYLSVVGILGSISVPVSLGEVLHTVG